MGAVEVRGGTEGQKELRAIRVRPSVCHRESASAIVSKFKILIAKTISID